MTAMRLWASTSRVSHVNPRHAAADTSSVPRHAERRPLALLLLAATALADPGRHRHGRLRRRAAARRWTSSSPGTCRASSRRAPIYGPSVLPRVPFMRRRRRARRRLGRRVPRRRGRLHARRHRARLPARRPALGAGPLTRRARRRDPHLPARPRPHARRADGPSGGGARRRPLRHRRARRAVRPQRLGGRRARRSGRRQALGRRRGPAGAARRRGRPRAPAAHRRRDHGRRRAPLPPGAARREPPARRASPASPPRRTTSTPRSSSGRCAR